MNLKFKNFFIFSLLFITLFNYSIFFLPNTFAIDNKTIYLTFDDGPGGKITSKVLDILKEESVPATFFLIGEQIKCQEDIIKRMYDEGHSLGLHSMSHNKGLLYSSNKIFLKEMLDTQEIINSIVGFKPSILRFPFGCNNNSYKISQSMVDLLHKNNLKIYDWNIDSGDGANPHANPDFFIKNAKSDKDNIILLMHCGYISKNSTLALPSIIKYYKDKGYVFKAIDENTQEEYHFIKK